MLATVALPVETGVFRCGERPSKSTPRFSQTLFSKKFVAGKKNLRPACRPAEKRIWEAGLSFQPRLWGWL